MYKIEIHATIHGILAVFYRLKMWCNDDETNLRERGQKLFYFIHLLSFTMSMSLKAYITDDKDERVLLTVVSILETVQVYRLWFVLWKKNELFTLLLETGTHYTNDEQEFIQVNNKLKLRMKFVQYFLIMCLIALIFANILPIINGKRLFFNIAFPFDRQNSETAFWVKFLYSAGAFFWSYVCCLYAVILWYLMLSLKLKYKMLGNQFKNMGKTQVKVSIREQRTLYVKDFIVAIQTYEKVNGYPDTNIQ